MAQDVGTRTPRTWRPVVVLALWLGLSVSPFLAGVLIPYYVNDLDALPLAELASGAHDPKDLWPQGTVGGYLQLAGFLSLSVTPIGLLVVGAFSGTAAVQEFVTLPGHLRAPRPVALAFVVVVLAVLALLSWFATPTASALTTWRLD